MISNTYQQIIVGYVICLAKTCTSSMKDRQYIVLRYLCYKFEDKS